MTTQVQINPARALDANVEPAAAAVAYFYDSGTTTPRTVYASDGTTALGVSITADGTGRFAQVFTPSSTAIKCVVKDSGGVTLYTIDPCAVSAVDGQSASDIAFTPVTGNAATNTQTAIKNIQDEVNLIATVGWTLLAQTTVAAQRSTLEAMYAPSAAFSGDMNDLSGTGLHRLAAPSANAWSGAGNGEHVLHAEYDSATAFQLGLDVDAATPIYFRRRTSSTWGSWGSIYSKSGVDALMLGVSQTFQDMSGSRAVNTSYQNTTGKPIQVMATTSGAGSETWEVSNDGSTWYAIGYATSNGDAHDVCFIVPTTGYYRINGTGATIVTWIELR